jgi:hypothetical protein
MSRMHVSARFRHEKHPEARFSHFGCVLASRDNKELGETSRE